MVEEYRSIPRFDEASFDDFDCVDNLVDDGYVCESGLQKKQRFQRTVLLKRQLQLLYCIWCIGMNPNRGLA